MGQIAKFTKERLLSGIFAGVAAGLMAPDVNAAPMDAWKPIKGAAYQPMDEWQPVKAVLKAPVQEEPPVARVKTPATPPKIETYQETRIVPPVLLPEPVALAHPVAFEAVPAPEPHKAPEEKAGKEKPAAKIEEIEAVSVFVPPPVLSEPVRRVEPTPAPVVLAPAPIPPASKPAPVQAPVVTFMAAVKADPIKAPVPKTAEISNSSAQPASYGSVAKVRETSLFKDGLTSLFSNENLLASSAADSSISFQAQKWAEVMRRTEEEWWQLPTDLQTLEGKSTRAKIEGVNTYFNRFRYISDKKNWGQSDRWATPTEFMSKGGDCEDYAIAKYSALRKLGIPEERMRMVIVRDIMADVDHAVLQVKTNEMTLILDNKTQSITDAGTISNYRPLFAVNNLGQWYYPDNVKYQSGNAQYKPPVPLSVPSAGGGANSGVAFWSSRKF